MTTFDPTGGYARGDFERVDGPAPGDLDGPRLLIGTRKGAWILGAGG
ncbi:MAG: hypothetical protein ACR2H3_06625 [Acidimicrobiales bacterium]